MNISYRTIVKNKQLEEFLRAEEENEEEAE
jgi:hypothetical protein